MKPWTAFAKNFGTGRFVRAVRVKVNRKQFEGDIEVAYLTGGLEGLEALARNKHLGLTLDEVWGEVEILLMERWNALAKVPGNRKSFTPQPLENFRIKDLSADPLPTASPDLKAQPSEHPSLLDTPETSIFPLSSDWNSRSKSLENLIPPEELPPLC